MEENIFPYENEEPLNPEALEELRMENEILRMKIIAEWGGIPGMEGNLPPEIENQFLKNVLEFEERQKEYVPGKLSLLLGNPVFKKEQEMEDEFFETEWQRLNELLEKNLMVVDFIRERDNRFKYRFITEELFEHETELGMALPGMIAHYLYEEFHPDHEQEITDRTMQFLTAWFERNTDAMNYGVVSSFIRPDGVILKQEEIIHKIQMVFDAYRSFEDCKYHFFEVKFELQEGGDDRMQGIGHSEGMVKYDAILENGERKTIEGPFKLYMTRDYDWWSVFYFVMEGFND